MPYSDGFACAQGGAGQGGAGQGRWISQGKLAGEAWPASRAWQERHCVSAPAAPAGEAHLLPSPMRRALTLSIMRRTWPQPWFLPADSALSHASRAFWSVGALRATKWGCPAGWAQAAQLCSATADVTCGRAVPVTVRQAPYLEGKMEGSGLTPSVFTSANTSCILSWAVGRVQMGHKRGQLGGQGTDLGRQGGWRRRSLPSANTAGGAGRLEGSCWAPRPKPHKSGSRRGAAATRPRP